MSLKLNRNVNFEIDSYSSLPPYVAVKPRAQSRLEAIHEGGSNRADQSDDVEDHGDARRSSLSKMAAGRPSPIEVLDHIKINNTKETPRSTIKGVLHSSNHEEIIFNRHNLREVEEKLKLAFVEFYQKLRLLKSYRLPSRVHECVEFC